MLVNSSISKLFFEYMRKEILAPNFLERINQTEFTYEAKKVKIVLICNTIILFNVLICNYKMLFNINSVIK